MVDKLIAELPKTSDPALRNAILGGLGSVDDATQVERIRNFALSKDVKVGEMAALFRGGRDTRAERDGMWKWAVAHYDQILARNRQLRRRPTARPDGRRRFQGRSGSTAGVLQGSRNQAPGAARGLAQTGETTLLCAALKQKQDANAILR